MRRQAIARRRFVPVPAVIQARWEGANLAVLGLVQSTLKTNLRTTRLLGLFSSHAFVATTATILTGGETELPADPPVSRIDTAACAVKWVSAFRSSAFRSVNPSCPDDYDYEHD